MNLPKNEARLEYSPKTTPHNRSMLAFAIAVPIGVLGGLIGLGGAEFRLPVLAGPLKYSAPRAVPLNLAISLVTLAVSLVIRGRTLSFAPLSPYVPAIGSLIAGAVITAIETVAPMGVGSAIGAIMGGLLVGITPAPVLKIGLGAILIFSAIRTFRHAK
ncbi:MAG: hypothetical protein Fur0044_16780 [Anaerolineae bacterium]|nr:TSUP family transporter [Anaerolineales bacterium]